MSGLSLRLNALRQAIGPAPWLIDVGTDHALLPLSWLAEHPQGRALGIDRAAAPLQRARENRSASPHASRLELLQQDGLGDLVPPRGAVLSMSGLGGLSIAQILEGGAQLHQLEGLALAPNDRALEVRSALQSLGWSIIAEDACWERDRYYPIIVAARRQGEGKPLDPLQLRFGPKLLENRHPALLRWLHEQGERLATIAEQRAPAPALIREQLSALRLVWTRYFAQQGQEITLPAWIDSKAAPHAKYQEHVL